MKCKITKIVWDVDDIMKEDGLTYKQACKNENLPIRPFVIEVPAKSANDDEISEKISDTYGFCHKGFDWKKL